MDNDFIFQERTTTVRWTEGQLEANSQKRSKFYKTQHREEYKDNKVKHKQREGNETRDQLKDEWKEKPHWREKWNDAERRLVSNRIDFWDGDEVNRL